MYEVTVGKHHLKTTITVENKGNKFYLRWLKTVSNTYIWIGRYNHCLSFDATIMVSKNCPIIGEHIVIIFLTQ